MGGRDALSGKESQFRDRRKEGANRNCPHGRTAVYSHSGILSAIKMNEVPTHAATWMSLENTVLS